MKQLAQWVLAVAESIGGPGLFLIAFLDSSFLSFPQANDLLITGLPIEKVSAALTMMELKGLVRQLGGMNYVAVHEEQADYSA